MKNAIIYTGSFVTLAVLLLVAAIATQVHVSGYVTVTLPIGTEPESIQIAEAVPPVLKNPPLPQHKPAVK